MDMDMVVVATATGINMNMDSSAERGTSKATSIRIVTRRGRTVMG